MIKKILASVVFCALYCSYVSAQNYTVLNDAFAIGGCHCYQLTSNNTGQGGGVYQNSSINLNNSFDYKFSIYPGFNNGGGADGMCFILTNNITQIGATGGGLGYGGLTGNSVAVEYDTYQNAWDPPYNHIAIEYGGMVQHPTGTLAGPVPAQASTAPIDDGNWHTTEIVWNATTQVLSVYLDGNLRLSYTGNIIANYFANNPVVNWGWSGSTGAVTNLQQFCVNSTSSWTAGANYQSCTPTMQFTDISTTNVGNVQSWAWNFGDPGSGTGDTSSKQNPVHTFSTTGVFNVTLIIVDISGCPDTFSHVVTIEPPITLAPTLTEPLCNGNSNGQISVAPSGGFGATNGYTYTWNNGPTTNVDPGLISGTYLITCTDGVCTTTASYLLNQPPILTAAITDSNVACFGAATGTASVAAAGGNGGYSYSWSNTSTNAAITGLVPNTYDVTVTDAKLCTVTAEAIITQPPSAFTVAEDSVNVKCFGASTGSITLTLSGGSAPYGIVHWSGGATGTSRTGLAAGSYSYTATDAHLCTVSGTVNITQPTSAFTITVDSTNVLCFGNSTGAITLVPAGGTLPYATAEWLDGFIGDTRNNLPANTYTYADTDQNGCLVTGTVHITQPASAFTMAEDSVNVKCFGASTGSITLALSGGTLPYNTVTWSGGATGTSRTGLIAGSYSYTASDAHNCSVIGTVNITQPASAFTIAKDSVNVKCFGNSTGSITLTPSGGTLPYAIAEWLDGATGDTRSNLPAATYFYGDTDHNGCLVTGSVNITQPASAFSITVDSTNVLCFGASTGTITLTPSGGTPPYAIAEWLDGAIGDTRSNLPANTYFYGDTDQNGCRATGAVNITQPPLIVASAAFDSISCFGANDAFVTITASGGTNTFTYELDNSGTFQASNIFTNLTAGSHTVTVQDGNSCTDPVTFSIYEPAQLAITLSNIINDSCFGSCDGSLTAAASGGTPPYQYSMNGTTYFLSGVFIDLCVNSSYTVYVTDAHSCKTTTPASITQPTVVVVSPVDSFPPACINGSNGYFDVTASGGTGTTYTYSLNNGPYQANGGSFTGLTPGSYTVTAKDIYGCTGSYTITVPNQPAISSFTTAAINDSCFGYSDGSIRVTVNGTLTPYTFFWLPTGATTQNLTNIPIGTYTVRVYDGNGCSVYGTDSTNTITQPTQVTATSIMTPVSCFGDSNGCINVTPTGGTGAFNNFWTNGITTNTNNPCGLKAGTYADTVTDEYGCFYITPNITVTQPTQLGITVDTVTPVSCVGNSDGAIMITATGGTPGYTYMWSQGSTANPVTGLAVGSYTVTVTDANSCTLTDVIPVGIVPPLVLSATVSNVLCPPLQNGSISLAVSGGTPSYQYTWSNGSTTAMISSLPAGVDNVTVTDARGCTLDTSFILINDSAFSVAINPDTATINEGDIILLTVQQVINNGAGPISSILWTPASNLSCSDCEQAQAAPFVTTQYMITVTTDSGCVSTAHAVITVNPQHQLYVPNVFTPNADGINDYWEIYGYKKAWVFCEAQVFDRWGEKVFESDDINFQWDGTFRGTMVQPGEYVYTIRIAFVDGSSTGNKGTITVIR